MTNDLLLTVKRHIQRIKENKGSMQRFVARRASLVPVSYCPVRKPMKWSIALYSSVYTWYDAFVFAILGTPSIPSIILHRSSLSIHPFVGRDHDGCNSRIRRMPFLGPSIVRCNTIIKKKFVDALQKSLIRYRGRFPRERVGRSILTSTQQQHATRNTQQPHYLFNRSPRCCCSC